MLSQAIAEIYIKLFLRHNHVTTTSNLLRNRIDLFNKLSKYQNELPNFDMVWIWVLWASEIKSVFRGL